MGVSEGSYPHPSPLPRRERGLHSGCGCDLSEAANYRFVLAVHEVDRAETDGASVLARIAVHRRIALLQGLFYVCNVEVGIVFHIDVDTRRRGLELVKLGPCGEVLGAEAGDASDLRGHVLAHGDPAGRLGLVVGVHEELEGP